MALSEGRTTAMSELLVDFITTVDGYGSGELEYRSRVLGRPGSGR
jgi:hypothetical protein